MRQGEIDWPAAHTRASHPETSRDAAERLAPHATAATLHAAACVRLTPGRTADELEAEHNPAGPEGRVRKRLKDAERLGLVRRGEKRASGVSGGSCVTWWPVEGEG